MKHTFYTCPIIILVSLFFLNSCSNNAKDKPNQEMAKESDVILVDSIPFKNGKNIFWYKLRDMLGSSSVSYIGLYRNSCLIDTSNVLVKGDLLYEIKLIDSQKLQITSHMGFDTFKLTNEIEFVNKKFEYGQKFIRNSLKDEIPLDSLCIKSKE